MRWKLFKATNIIFGICRDQDLADIEIFILDVRNASGSRSFEIKIDGNNFFEDISSNAFVDGNPNDTSSSQRDRLLDEL